MNSPLINRRIADWIGGTIEVLLIALLSAMPFALGVVAPWSEAIVVAVVAVIALLLSARAWLVPDRQQSLAWAFTPITLFIAVAAAQLLPLPASVVGAVSPHALAIRSQLLSDLPGAAGLLNRVTLSLYPAATCHDLRLILVYSVVFLTAVQVFCREGQYIRCLWAITLSGGAAAMLALLQDLSGASKIYWVFGGAHETANGGPFVSYSNYSQYINLCTGAALGLLLHTLRRDDILKTEGNRTARRPHAGWKVSELRSWRAWPPLAVGALGFVTVCLSLSRGGMLSILCSIALTLLMLARRRGMRGAAWILALAALAAFACLLYFGFDAVCDRLATLKTARDPSAGRIQTFKDILVEWRKFTLVGTGLGTHEYVYPMFDRSSDPDVAEYADSDYFQVLEEMGAVGLALVVSFAGYIWICYGRAIRRGRPRLNVIAYGLGFGLLAVMVQSMTDFGQHLPAIACISAVYCGMLVNLSRAPRRSESAASKVAIDNRSTGSLAALESRWPAIVVTTAGALAMAWAVLGADASRRSQAAAERAASIAERLDGTDWKGTDAEFAQLLSVAGDAVAAEPGNVKQRYLLACYRWHIASASIDDARQNGQSADPAATSPAPGGLEAVRIVDELNVARKVCPTFGPAYAVAGQIERLVLNQPIGSKHVRTAYQLAPANPEVCLAAAQLDAFEGKFDDALHKAQRSIALDPTFVTQVTNFFIHDADRPDLAVSVVGDDPQLLMRVCEDLNAEQLQSERPDLRTALATAHRNLTVACERPDAPPWALEAAAGIYRDEKDYSHAIACVHRAIQKEYWQTDHHMALAYLLVDAGQRDEAVHEAEICLRLRPGLETARSLIDDVNARPTLTEAKGSASTEDVPQE